MNWISETGMVAFVDTGNKTYSCSPCNGKHDRAAAIPAFKIAEQLPVSHSCTPM